MIFIYIAISKRNNTVLSIVTESLPNLKTGAIRDFENLLRDMGLYSKFEINQTDRTYKFGSNIIEFFSVQGESNRLGSRRQYLYINEADSITYDTFLALKARTDKTYLDFNPKKKFWVHTELENDDKVDFIKLTYLDNEFIPKSELESILWYKNKYEETGSKYYLNKWKVFGLGELGVVEGGIFEEDKDWSIISELPEEARYIGSSCDFGFSHVTAIVKLYRYYDKIIIDESLFKSSLTTPRIAKHIKNDSELLSTAIPCDSSRPEQVKELRSYGIPCISHKKRDVLSGIDLMHSFEILITSSSENVIDEFRNYCYATDKNGVSLGVPNKSMDKDNSIDAARYGFEYFLSNTRKNNGGFKVYSFG
ncbi:hypothetical protein ULVI_09385 [Cochleicola gelatinilyticus]|uniref:Uncharacterized protein n=2 Tax=Cochleicola gelatinilyticus TaxID=1763537 RepID=A0A167HMZ1_9FLAO|nr:hypothetical protein ULVI_09385 [Cochleicola gelatinilyticus]